jgi:hypothetical protein
VPAGSRRIDEQRDKPLHSSEDGDVINLDPSLSQ